MTALVESGPFRFCWMRFSVAVSRQPVASSTRTTRGFAIRARAAPTRCR